MLVALPEDWLSNSLKRTALDLKISTCSIYSVRIGSGGESYHVVVLGQEGWEREQQSGSEDLVAEEVASEESGIGVWLVDGVLDGDVGEVTQE